MTKKNIQSSDLPSSVENVSAAFASGALANANGVPNGQVAAAYNGAAIWRNPLTFDPTDPRWGVKADGRTVTDAAITSGTNQLSSASAAFTSADIGKCAVVMGAGSSAPAATLTSNLSTGSPITSLPATVGATAIPAGPVFIVGNSGNICQTFVTTGALAGATSIPVTSQTPNYAYPSGATVQTPQQHLYGWISAVSGGVASLVTTSGGSTPANAGTTVSNAELTYCTDDYAALQACISAAFAANGTVDLPSKPVGVAQTPTAPATSGAIRGQGCFELWGTVAAQGNFNALTIPTIAPHFVGSSIVVMQPNIDGLFMGGIGVTQDLDGFGIRFAGAFSQTGHGVNSQSTSQGLTGHTFRRVKVYGHDGNHYSFVCNSQIEYAHEHLRWYGGGGLKHLNTAAGNVGNHTSVSCYGITFVYGTANGIDLSASAGQWGLAVFTRPQSWVAYPQPAIAGVAPPTSAQQQLRSNVDTTVQNVTWIGVDFETNVNSTVIYPVYNCSIMGSGRKGATNAANNNSFGGALTSGTSYQNITGTNVLLTIAFTMNPTGSAAATVYLYIGPATNPNTEIIELSTPATGVAGEIQSATIVIPPGYYFQYIATNATRNWNNAPNIPA